MGELPPQPDEVTMDELMELARQLKEHPENRPGSDKTWVLEGLRSFQRFIRSVREEAFRIEDGPESSWAAKRAAAERRPPT